MGNTMYRVWVKAVLSLCLCAFAASPATAREKRTNVEQEDLLLRIEAYKKENPQISESIVKFALERDMKPEVVQVLIKEVDIQKLADFKDYDIEIAYDLYEVCGTKFYSNYYKCSCTAVQYVESMRQKAGEGDYQFHMNTAQSKCPFVESAANAAYVECANTIAIMDPAGDYDQSKYCGCYANTYAKKFEKYPSLERSDRYNMRYSAHRACSKKFKPQRP